MIARKPFKLPIAPDTGSVMVDDEIDAGRAALEEGAEMGSEIFDIRDLLLDETE